jgi:pimeloyl-ACP methyl ester carboxylesterase
VSARLLPLLLVVTLASACTADESSSPAAAPAGASSHSEGELAMTCQGEGSPTVVLEAGLDTSGATFSNVAESVAETTRVCLYDRAGVGDSPKLADDAPDPWPGSSADSLAEELDRRGEVAPYVVLGWSYGGMVAQAFATRHPDLTSGLVLEDSSVPQQFVDPEWDDIAWEDGERVIDQDTAVAELSEVDLGDLPVVVLTSDEMRGRLRKVWDGYHDRLAASSTDAVHVLARRATHAIHHTNVELVVAAVEGVVEAARAGSTVSPCDERWRDLGGRCL